jgi:hypothetical protein
MWRKIILISAQIVLFSQVLCVQAVENMPEEITTEFGMIRKGMPKEELKERGFTESNLVSSIREGNQEYLTFSDWTASREGDNITFYIVEGKIEDWFKGEDVGTIEKGENRK